MKPKNKQIPYLTPLTRGARLVQKLPCNSGVQTIVAQKPAGTVDKINHFNKVVSTFQNASTISVKSCIQTNISYLAMLLCVFVTELI